MTVKVAVFTAILLCILSLSGYAETITVSGKVTEKYSGGSPLWNVHISVNRGNIPITTTDENGYYLVEVNEDDLLIFSFIGYNVYETKVDGRAVIDVEMDCEDCGWQYVTKGQRQSAHDFSALANYTSNGWGYAFEYAYLPPISSPKKFFSKVLRYTDLNLRVQNLPHSGSDVRFYPHLRFSIPFSIPLFTSRQKLSPFVNAGYYFDTDFEKTSRHNWGVGGGLKTRIAYISFKGMSSRYMYVYLTVGYTVFIGAEQKDNIYLGLKFYFSRYFVFF